MASKIKQKKFSRTATETNADILERIGGSGGAAYRSSRAKRPDILKLKNKKKPLPTKSDAAKMVKANKASKFNKMNKKKDKKAKNVAGRAGIVARKAVKVVAPLSVSAGAGAAANQWINQGPEKKK
jgi:hypothetical protein